MSGEANDVDNKIYEGLTVWTLFGSSLMMAGYIVSSTFKDIMRSDREYLSMLKDSYTIFYTVFVILSLLFKLFIIDTYFKDEIRSGRKCSMFISDYMP